MKKQIFIIFALIALTAAGCKKESTQPKEDVTVAKKYAKYRLGVTSDKELTKWMATLSKTESVDLLSVEKAMVKNKETEVAHIKLSDDSKGYVEMRHLAERPLVFTEDTKLYVRNNTGSRMRTTIPLGTIAFVISEKGNWLHIDAGKIDGKWIGQGWVNGGCSSDEKLIIEARTYEDSVNALSGDSVKPEKKEEARTNLKELSSSASVFGPLASEKLKSLEEQSSETSITTEETEEKENGTSEDGDTAKADEEVK